ncbi:hypothetical protein LVB77_12180 [Lysobacter sp. 5GHs7-4]|uniref:hypothetical protein n=1 Tax=Lysobacter sp. 5GHs7-4 TaxID=2904253 RepID=UPI001E51FF89|nr:hypothetical protein [Lysobacter sp. 5GHs7-4]UHQ21441.1 hypothetical protein LVB77_12180 [Lysobacter sp. 5GHs7-4]
MKTIDHFRELQQRLGELSADKQVRFAIWSVFPFTRDSAILKFVDGLSHAGTSTDISSSLEALWNNLDDVEALSRLCSVVSIDWNPDEVEMEQEDASQGAVDFLSAIGCLCEGIQGDTEKLIEPGKFLINRMDYKADFSEDDEDRLIYEEMYKDELVAQNKLIDELQSKETIAAIDRHHEAIVWR